MTMTKSIDEQIDRVLEECLGYPEQDDVSGIYTESKQAIKSLIAQAEKEARIDEQQEAISDYEDINRSTAPQYMYERLNYLKEQTHE
jgi:hypothetical protein